MWLRWYVEQVTRVHFDDSAICEGSGGRAGDHEPDVLHLAAILSQFAADVLGPAPAGLIGGAADTHTADAHQLESTLGHFPDLIRMLEALQDHLRRRFAHWAPHLVSRWLLNECQQIRYACSLLPGHFLSKAPTLMHPSLDSACAAAVSALEHEPFYRSITSEFEGDDARRRAALAAYFDDSVRQGTRIGRVVHLEAADIGVAVWVLPQSDEVQERERLRKRVYLVGVLGEAGYENYARIVDFMSERARTIVGKDAWYLSIVAVAPQAQGRGLGARLLEPTLAEADAASAVCYLETFGTRSLHFYERLGFVTLAKFDEPTTRARYAVMVRVP
jgi:ribosomal protein S18 acetylase RimI-like enzyme